MPLDRGTESPLSPCERDSGVSVFGLAWPPPSLPLCPGSCFSLSLFVLASTQWHLAATRSPACARADAHASQTCARYPAFVCFGSDEVPLTRTSKHQQSAKHTSMFTFTEAWTRTPRVHTPNPTECVGLKQNVTLITSGIMIRQF